MSKGKRMTAALERIARALEKRIGYIERRK